MFKVMCVSDKWFYINVTHTTSPKYGETYIVIGEHTEKVWEQTYLFYELKGIQGMWSSKGFIPLSEEDEMKRLEEILEKMFVPVNNLLKNLIL